MKTSTRLFSIVSLAFGIVLLLSRTAAAQSANDPSAQLHQYLTGKKVLFSWRMGGVVASGSRTILRIDHCGNNYLLDGYWERHTMMSNSRSGQWQEQGTWDVHENQMQIDLSYRATTGDVRQIQFTVGSDGHLMLSDSTLSISILGQAECGQGDGTVSAPQNPASTTNATRVVLEQHFDTCAPMENQTVYATCRNGELEVTAKDTILPRYVQFFSVLQDTVIEVTTRMPAQQNARFGVMFRLDETATNFYLLSVTNDGSYGLFRFADGQFITLVPFTKSYAVGSAGSPTRIKIVNQGDVIAINFNDKWVDSVRDSSLGTGRVGLFLYANQLYQTALFDDFRVSEILSPLAVPQPRVAAPPPEPTPQSAEPYSDCIYVETIGDVICPHDNNFGASTE